MRSWAASRFKAVIGRACQLEVHATLQALLPCIAQLALHPHQLLAIDHIELEFPRLLCQPHQVGRPAGRSGTLLAIPKRQHRHSLHGTHSTPGSRRLDVTCDHVTAALHAMHEMPGVRSATIFGQSMHLLVDETVKRAQIEEQLRKVGVLHTEIHEMGPSLEDVFVELSAKHAAERQKAA